jgi:hypothetical protein
VAPSPLPELKTLRNFIYDALDINYIKTDKSHALLNPDENIKHYFAKQVWNSCRDMDVAATFTTKNLKKPHLFSRTNLHLHN